MREFSWNVFAVTGNIEAYLLYKECQECNCSEEGSYKLGEDVEEAQLH